MPRRNNERHSRNLRVPAVNNHGSFGRWAFIEIVDPWDARNAIRKFLLSASGRSR